MPFAGYLVYTGRFNLFWAATAGAIGCNVGSVLAYWIGAAGGRPLVERYGQWVLMSHHDLDRMTHFFEKYGTITVLLGRLLAGGSHIHRVSRGHRQNAAASLSHLHVHRVVAVVLRAGLCGHEARRKVAYRSTLPGMRFIASIWWLSSRLSPRSSGLSGRTSIASAGQATRRSSQKTRHAPAGVHCFVLQQLSLNRCRFTQSKEGLGKAMSNRRARRPEDRCRQARARHGQAGSDGGRPGRRGHHDDRRS